MPKRSIRNALAMEDLPDRHSLQEETPQATALQLFPQPLHDTPVVQIPTVEGQITPTTTETVSVSTGMKIDLSWLKVEIYYITRPTTCAV